MPKWTPKVIPKSTFGRSGARLLSFLGVFWGLHFFNDFWGVQKSIKNEETHWLIVELILEQTLLQISSILWPTWKLRTPRPVRCITGFGHFSKFRHELIKIDLWAILEAMWPAMCTQNRSKTVQKMIKQMTHFIDRFWNDFESQISPKLGPRWAHFLQQA